MSDSVELRARRAAAGLRVAVAGVEPRRIESMAGKRTRTLGALAIVVLGAAGVGLGIGLSGRSGSLPPSSDLLPAASLPTGTATTTFGPPGLGVTIQVPQDWRPAPAASGFQYVELGPGFPNAFLLATRLSGARKPGSLAQVGSERSQYLRSLHGVVQSVTTGSVGGRPAVRLHYTLPGNGNGAVDDTEYDILLPSLSEGGVIDYPRLIIAFGGPVPNHDLTLLNEIAASLRLSDTNP